MLRTATAEKIHHHSDALSVEKIAFLGRLAIKSEFLGINDPLSHLHQYIIRGEEALVGIKEDIETDIAERLPKTPFVNYVGFEFTGNDFVSLRDKVSMDSMTKTNLQIFKTESANNPDLAREFERAKIEAQEVAKLVTWFKNAPIGANLVFESLPIGEQKFAISRIYQKTSGDRLEGCFVSLYSSDIEQFNKFRETMIVNAPTGKTEKEILQNNYEFYEPKLASPKKFIDFYVGIYDYLLQEHSGRQYSFGIETDNRQEKKNGLMKVRSQPKLTSIYLDTVKALASSEGIVTPELLDISDKLNIGYPLAKGQKISIKMAHNVLSEVILGITSVIDKADDKLLYDLESSDINQGANYAAVSHYGGQAKASGETYASNGCPEYNRSNTSETESTNDVNYEYDSISRAFNIMEKLDDFGKPKIGVCRISNCPSRGDLGWLPDKTLVGGCDICVCCHKLFKKGKSPKIVYKYKDAKRESAIKKFRKTA